MGRTPIAILVPKPLCTLYFCKVLHLNSSPKSCCDAAWWPSDERKRSDQLLCWTATSALINCSASSRQWFRAPGMARCSMQLQGPAQIIGKIIGFQSSSYPMFGFFDQSILDFGDLRSISVVYCPPPHPHSIHILRGSERGGGRALSLNASSCPGQWPFKCTTDKWWITSEESAMDRKSAIILARDPKQRGGVGG